MAHPLRAYVALIDDLRVAGFACHPIRDYFTGDRSGDTAGTDQTRTESGIVYLRHDVDRLPRRAVAMAEAEAELGVRSTYYFRCDARLSFPGPSMHRVEELGHETGFHYESLSRTHGDRAAALALFQRELAACRAVVPVTTVAPHGAPLAASSNMEFTDSIDTVRMGLLGDATEMDFTKMLYVTDTGGTFGSPYNLRDRTAGPMLDDSTHPKHLVRRLEQHGCACFVLSCHPERWPKTMPGLMIARTKDHIVNLAKAIIMGPFRSGQSRNS